MGVFCPENPLFPISGILTPVVGRRIRKVSVLIELHIRVAISGQAAQPFSAFDFMKACVEQDTSRIGESPSRVNF